MLQPQVNLIKHPLRSANPPPRPASSQHPVASMALPLRCAMLSRAIASQSPARVFSTSIALRLPPPSSYPPRPFESRNRHSNESRSNPLVGNTFVPPAPAKPSSDISAPPPPPPPPPASSSTAPSPTTNIPFSSSSSSSFSTNPAATQFSFERPTYPASATESAAQDSSAYDASKPFDLADILSEKASTYGASLAAADPLTRPLIRTRPPTGRTVFIGDRLSPTSATTPIVAVRVLERMCREQKVKNKFHSQKFHERKGVKRKRLRSERWRARFKVGFKAAVSKVMELKRQGW